MNSTTETENSRSISQSNKIYIQLLMKQFETIESRLWHIMIVLLIESLSFIGVLVVLLIQFSNGGL